MSGQTPSPEVKAILKDFCAIQRAKYGPAWKSALAAEMAQKTMQDLKPLLALMCEKK